MKAISIWIALAAALVPIVGNAAEWTTAQLVKEMNYDGDADVSWFLGNAKWGSAGCPNATWVFIPASVAGRKQLLSIGLAASAAGKVVAFWGTCDSSDRFSATYVRVIS